MNGETARKTALELTNDRSEQWELFDNWINGEFDSPEQMKNFFHNEIEIRKNKPMSKSVYDVIVTDVAGRTTTHRQVTAEHAILLQQTCRKLGADIEIEQVKAWSVEAVTGNGRFGCE